MTESRPRSGFSTTRASLIADTVPTASAVGSDIVVGDDGRARCAWAAKDPEYRRYHDEEWGTPLHGDRPLFEKLSLEAFQSGLSWITILKRRPAFRQAFANFQPEEVSQFDETKVEQLLQNEAIIRNRAKVIATIENARRTVDLVRDAPGALDELMWSFAPTTASLPPVRATDVPASTEASTALSVALKARGFRFVGPTTMYALMQSTGMVDDHLAGCWRASAEAARRSAVFER